MSDIRVRIGQQNAIKVVSSSTPGAPGSQGLQGTQGVGFQGSQGLSGAFIGQGLQGLQGTQGVGIQGPQGLDGQFAGQGTQGTIGQIPVAKTYIVTVSDGVYYIDGIQQDTLHLLRGQRYILNQVSGSNSGHPIAISTVSDGTHNSGDQYTDGWQYIGDSGFDGYGIFDVPAYAPDTLYYYCQIHPGMGGTIQIKTLTSDSLIGSQGLQGVQGNFGLQGISGEAVNQGTQGLQGNQGLSVQGSLGLQGLQGLDGQFAGQGVQGAAGVGGGGGGGGESYWALGATGIGTLSSVGIGTLNPQADFDLRGNANISGIVTAHKFVGFATGLLGISQGNTHYVSIDGSDSNDGTSLSSPYRTIKYALSQSTSGDNISIGAGTFSEDFPLTIPQGVSVNGSGIRGTFIEPTSGTRQKDCFLMNGETEVTDLTIGNMYHPGWAFRFASNMITTLRSPYVQRVTVLNRGSSYDSNDPYGFNTVHNPPVTYKSGRGILIDGSVVNPATLEPAILFNECTFITPNNTALEMTNGARTEWVNCFSYFADKAIYGHSQSVGLGSTGKTRIKVSGVTETDTVVENDLLYYFDENTINATFDSDLGYLTVNYNSHGLVFGDKVLLTFVPLTDFENENGVYSVVASSTNTFSVNVNNQSFSSGNTVTYKKVVGFGTVSSYSNGVFKLKGKGGGVFQTAASRSGKQVLVYNDAKITTSQFKFGTGSAQFDGAGDYLQILSNSDFGLSTGEFTLECFVKVNGSGTTQTIFDMREVSTSDEAPNIGITTSNRLFYDRSYNAIYGSTILSPGNWYHVALVRSPGDSSIRLYLDGNLQGEITDSIYYGDSKPLRIGLNVSSQNPLNGYVDEVRLSTVGRYSGSSYTVPTAPFVSDANTKLLLHCDGDSGSVIFTDSTVVTQDVRSVSSVGIGSVSKLTANKITLADYQEFGASMRSIGSAAVFGNTGITADGLGVNFRLFAFNFGHIGAGGDFSQDESLVVQANEVIESNGGAASYVSIDQSGDFRVGDAFYVNEQKGYVTFGGQTFDITSLSNLEVTDGTNSTNITPTSVTVGNIQVSSNEVTTVSGNLDINPSGISSTRVVGDLNVTGIVTATRFLGPGSLQSRTTSVQTTGSIGTGTTTDITFSGFKSYMLMKVQTSADSWVRIYSDTTSRSADSSRNEGTDPLPGSGVIAEVITTGAQTQLLTPGVIGFNNDGTPSSNIYAKVTNKSGITTNISVTLSLLQLEI